MIKAKMPTQHIRRIRTLALDTFKILNGLAPQSKAQNKAHK
jgi:hypothetical protein